MVKTTTVQKIWMGKTTTIQVFDHMTKNLDGKNHYHPSFWSHDQKNLDSSRISIPLFLLVRFWILARNVDFRIFYVDRRNGFWSTSRCGKKTSSTVKLSYWCTQAEICGLIIWIICYTWLLWSSVSLLPIRLVCLLSLRARHACVRSVLFCLFLFPQVASLVSFIVIECTYDTLSNYLQLVWDLTFYVNIK